jgi:hypothetical protein
MAAVGVPKTRTFPVRAGDGAPGLLDEERFGISSSTSLGEQLFAHIEQRLAGCLAGACQPVVLATGQNPMHYPRDIGVDDKAVYWSNDAGSGGGFAGSIMKLAK